jgi:hypothetical protein
MTEFENKLSYEELLAENSTLKTKIDELTKQNILLEGKLRSLQDNQGYEICEYFNECNSLQQTADHFLYDDIVDCGNALMDFNGCSDSIQGAKDYKEFRLLAYGSEEYSDSDYDTENDEEDTEEEDTESEEEDTESEEEDDN